MNGGYILLDFENNLIENFGTGQPISHSLAEKLYNGIKYAKDSQKAIGIRNLKFDDGSVLTGFYSVMGVTNTNAIIYIGFNSYENDVETTIDISISNNTITFGTNN